MTNLQYYCKEQEIRLQVRGTEMEGGYNLYHLNRIFHNIQKIMDKAFLIYHPDKSKISDKDRESFKIKVISFEKGSLITLMALSLIAANQATLSFSIPFTPEYIWLLFRQAHEFLTFVLDAFDKGKTVQTNEGDNGVNITINGGNNRIVVLPQALVLARNASEEIYSLANSIDAKGGIKEIAILDNSADSKPILFNEANKKLFRKKKRLMKEPAHVIGRIFRIDGHSLTGRLEVLESTDPHIKPGNEYSFTLEEDYILETCREAFMEKATIAALKEMVLDPSELKETIN